MKLSLALVAAATAEDKKVPPRHPLQRLERLVEFSHEMLDQHYGFLPSVNSWKNKFENNAERMERNFNRGNQRCGFYDANQLPHGGPSERKRRADDEDFRYNREDPCHGAKQITTGFRKWAERYLSQCSGQRNSQFQVRRMNRWYAALAGHLDCPAQIVRECPAGWIERELTQGTKCLQVNKGKYKWNTALSTCQEQNSRLAQPQSEADNRLFCDLIGYNKYDMWYAGNDIDRDGKSTSIASSRFLSNFSCTFQISGAMPTTTQPSPTLDGGGMSQITITVLRM